MVDTGGRKGWNSALSSVALFSLMESNWKWYRVLRENIATPGVNYKGFHPCLQLQKLVFAIVTPGSIKYSLGSPGIL